MIGIDEELKATEGARAALSTNPNGKEIHCGAGNDNLAER